MSSVRALCRFLLQCLIPFVVVHVLRLISSELIGVLLTLQESFVRGSSDRFVCITKERDYQANKRTSYRIQANEWN